MHQGGSPVQDKSDGWHAPGYPTNQPGGVCDMAVLSTRLSYVGSESNKSQRQGTAKRVEVRCAVAPCANCPKM